MFDDVDIDPAVEWVTFGAFVNQGQVCTATSRLLIHEAIADRFLKRLVEVAQGIRIGSGAAEGVEMGPLVSQVQYDKVMSYIAAGKKRARRCRPAAPAWRGRTRAISSPPRSLPT